MIQCWLLDGSVESEDQYWADPEFSVLVCQMQLGSFYSLRKITKNGMLCLQNIHQGYPTETLLRFLKARDFNVHKSHKMVLSFPSSSSSSSSSSYIGLFLGAYPNDCKFVTVA